MTQHMTPKKLLALSFIANVGFFLCLLWGAAIVKRYVVKEMDKRCALGLSLQTTKRDSTQYVLDHFTCTGR